MIDKNSKVIQIGDIVKIEGSPIKTANALYVVEQDGTSALYCGNDLTLCRVVRTPKGYTLSKAANNICFYPLVCYSTKYKYSHDELAAATIEIIKQASLEQFQIIKANNNYEPKEHEKDYYLAAVTEGGKQITDVGYLVSQAEKLTAFFSNLALKDEMTLTLLKYSGDRDNNSRHGIPYELRKR